MPISYIKNADVSGFLIPAPLVGLTKTFVRGNDSEILSSQYNFTLNGTIVNVGSIKSSPGASGTTFGNMDGVVREQERIRQIFSEDGGVLHISSPNGVSGILSTCNIDSIDFTQSTWTTRCDYTIGLSSIQIDDEDYNNITSSSEEWNIEENIDKTYAITHSIAATAATYYDGLGDKVEGITAAQDWCEDRAYIIQDDGTLVPNVDGIGKIELDIDGVLGNNFDGYWNYSKTEGVGVFENSWNIAEAFIYHPSGNAREQWSLTDNYDSSNDSRYKFTIAGTVTGYTGRARDTEIALTNAESHWTTYVEDFLYTRVNNNKPADITVNPAPTSTTVVRNRSEGTLDYTWEFVGVRGTILPDALEENINVSDIGNTDVFAQLPVPGRAYGPVVQYMETVTLPERTVSIDALMIPPTGGVTLASLQAEYLAKPDSSAIIDALKPNNSYYYIKQNTESWNPLNRRYARTITWTMDLLSTTLPTGTPPGDAHSTA